MLLSLSLENREDNVGVLLLSICELREALPVFFFFIVFQGILPLLFAFVLE